MRGRRQFRRISLFCALICPLLEKRDLRVRQPTLTFKLPMRVSFPGRHQAGLCHEGNLPSALLGIRIGGNGKGRNFTLPVAGRAVLIENWRDVL